MTKEYDTNKKITEETDVKQPLLDNVQEALLDFNNTFGLFAINQKIFLDVQWEIIDLLLYHVYLKCYVIVDLKARQLKRGASSKSPGT